MVITIVAENINEAAWRASHRADPQV